MTDPDSRPAGRAAGGGGAPQTPLRSGKGTPPGTPFRHPYSAPRQLARARALGLVPGPHARTHRTRGIRVAEPRLPAPEGGRLGEGQRPGPPGAPHNGGRPPGNGGPPPAPRHTAPTGRASQGDSAGPQHPHNRTHGTAANPNSPPGGRAVGGRGRLTSDAPHDRERCSPPGMPFRQPHSVQRRPARARPRYGAGAGPPRPHQPHSGHTGRRQADEGGTAPDGRRPSQGIQATGTVLGLTLVPRARGQRAPALPGGGQPEEGESPASDAPRNVVTTDGGGRAPYAHTRTRTPGRETSVRAPQPTPRSANSTYTSQGKSAPHPLLLGTGTQQWWNPRPHA